MTTADVSPMVLPDEKENAFWPHWVKPLDEAAISHSNTGFHRWGNFSELVASKEKRDEVSRAAMDALAAQAQELKMGYQ
ncbi:hypothetical protein ACIP1G_27480 [Pseudomonas sp. NPDC089392]|uniref:hypothetical protein n=1 Tax=Pseudomonas sp. NPDC089392 TaxID=3364459 RepID=UPI00382A6B72